MLFCDSFTILQPTDPIPKTGKIGLSLWPVDSNPILSNLKSLSFDSLSDVKKLREISLLAVFTYVAEKPEDDMAACPFPIETFRDCFDSEGFEHPITLSHGQGFCFVLTGKDAPIISQCRCISLQQVVSVRPLKGGTVRSVKPVFTLFPPLSKMSVRFPIVAPPHSESCFLPTKPKIVFFSHERECESPKQIKWQKTDKLEKWREHLTQVLDRIYVGSSSVASDDQLLKKEGITHTINCASQVVNSLPDYVSLKIPMSDGGDENILSHLWTTTTFLENALKKKDAKILVHCVEGISRSVSVVIGYLIITKQMDYATAYRVVRKQRRIASPHPKFIAQLMQLCEMMGSTKTHSCFFSKEGVLPFSVCVRRDYIVALPVYQKPVEGDDKCLVLVNYNGAPNLYRGENCDGAIINLKVGSEVKEEIANVAVSLVCDLRRCLNIQKAVDVAANHEIERKTFISGDWQECDDFGGENIDPDKVCIVYECSQARIYIGSEVKDDGFDPDDALKQCCNANKLSVPSRYTIIKNPSKTKSRNSPRRQRVHFV